MKKIYSENSNGISLDDIQEAVNHFKAFDYILDNSLGGYLFYLWEIGHKKFSLFCILLVIKIEIVTFTKF